MRYYFEILYKLERKNILNICIDVICLSLGFLIAIIFMGQASAAYTEYESNKKCMSLDDYLICIPQEESIRPSKSELYKLISDYDDINGIQVCNRKNGEMVIFDHSFCPDITIMEVTEHFFDIFEQEYMVGSKLIDNKCAIIGKKGAEQYGICIGDEVVIANNKIKICGVLDVPQYENNIFVLETTIDNSELYDCQYFIKLSKSKEQLEFIDLLESVYGKYDVYSGKAYMDLQKDRLLTGWGGSIVIAIVTICYGLINIYNIESFFVIKQKREMAILRALGASSKYIIIVKLVRSLIIAVASSSVTSFIIWILEHTRLTELIEFHLNYWVYLSSTILIMWIYAIFSYVLYRIHYSGEILGIISKA